MHASVYVHIHTHTYIPALYGSQRRGNYPDKRRCGKELVFLNKFWYGFCVHWDLESTQWTELQNKDRVAKIGGKYSWDALHLIMKQVRSFGMESDTVGVSSGLKNLENQAQLSVNSQLTHVHTVLKILNHQIIYKCSVMIRNTVTFVSDTQSTIHTEDSLSVSFGISVNTRLEPLSTS